MSASRQQQQAAAGSQQVPCKNSTAFPLLMCFGVVKNVVKTFAESGHVCRFALS
jgi:hypothetical protein